MPILNCLIVEDEPLAAEVLADYIKQVQGLHLAGVCSDALYAMEVLAQQPIDLLFLDIHLPKLKGLDFLKALQQRPQVILTTAYSEYALQGYELNVVDYLLKPIAFNRFLAAVQKVISKKAEVQNAAPVRERPSIFFNVGRKRVKLFLDEILYIESLKEYVRITTKEKSILTKFTLSDMEALLLQENFLRTHRSFIVAKDKIEALSASDVEINGQQIPIGRSFKDAVFAALN